MGIALTMWAGLLVVLLGRLATANPRGRQSEGPQDCLRQMVRAKLLQELDRMTDAMTESLPVSTRQPFHRRDLHAEHS